jgi:hypothetical protein
MVGQLECLCVPAFSSEARSAISGQIGHFKSLQQFVE